MATDLLMLLIIGLLMTSCSTESLEDSDEERCSHWEEAFAHNQASVTASVPPNLRGKWVSESCEIRPGPEFLLRRYHFFANQTVWLQQFYYQDESCALLSYSVTASGHYRIIHPSWVVPGAMEADFSLNKVSVVPYTKMAAQALSKKVNKTCPGFVRRPWRNLRKYKIFTYTEFDNQPNHVEVKDDIDCTSALDWSATELQLIRLEHRKAFHPKHRPRALRTELYLGDIHTDKRMRSFHRPTSYQPPLKRAEDLSCPICHIVSKPNELSPPQLPARALLPVFLPGEWISTHCEVRPFGLFLTRRLHFKEDGVSWSGIYRYFRDPNCLSTMFFLRVEGTFTTGRPSRVLKGATEYDFHVERANLTPQDDMFTSNLNGFDQDLCGPRKSWKTNVTQDVTSTRGCLSIGLTIPNTEYDVVRTEMDHFGNSELYLGKVDSENKPSGVKSRPTSYQAPLVQCGYGHQEHNAIYPLALMQVRTPSNGGLRHYTGWIYLVLLYSNFHLSRIC